MYLSNPGTRDLWHHSLMFPLGTQTYRLILLFQCWASRHKQTKLNVWATLYQQSIFVLILTCTLSIYTDRLLFVRSPRTRPGYWKISNVAYYMFKIKILYKRECYFKLILWTNIQHTRRLNKYDCFL